MSDSHPHVLLVDDDTRLVELIGASLELQGFVVTPALSPREAVTLLEGISFDAVVTDVVFDTVQGGTLVLEAARELQPDAVVVLMTGYPAIDKAVAAMKGGAVDYLQKPVKPATLGATVRRALRERRFRREGERLCYAELVDILSEMVANSIERVDPYTAGHGERTRKYCRILAGEVGLDRTTTERLELAAIAHDYGKIYLDDLGFLTKKGPLTREEYSKVQEHPQLGATKLGTHPHLREVCHYVAEHHERWDGSGYPNRRRHEEISLPGRILCVVEVFDSLSTKRSYKDVRELSKTIEFFGAQSGRGFDPQITELFVDLLAVHGEEWMAAPQKDLAAVGLAAEG